MLITKYQIGQQFTLTRKHSKQDRTIVDIHVTRNTSDEIVKIRYVTEHTFMGQVVIDSDVVPVTIARSLH